MHTAQHHMQTLMQADETAAAGGEQEEEEQALNRIQVVVRVRPVLPHEASQQVSVTCCSDGASVQVVLPEREFAKPAIAASTKADAKAYTFDACLTGSTTQAELFDVCGISELVDAALDGFNVTVFAFGQTGSGKTYSILGPGMAGMQGFEEDSPAGTAAGQHSSSSISSAHPGAAELDTAGTAALSNSPAASNSSSQDGPRTPQRELPEHEGLLVYCVHHLFGSIAACRNSLQCSVTISCTEVYNETVTDMLARNNKSQQLPVRLDPRTDTFYAEGLTHAAAQTPARALRVLSDALASRHTRAHKLNSYSSRSHCLVTLTVSSQEVGSSPGQELMSGIKGGMRRCGKLVLVDLAGSERLNSTGNSGQRESLKETGAINKSLFTLGQVLAALSVRGGVGGNSHVPFRDSRLTQLLWEGLRGGGRVLMLACLCPLKSAAEESLNTLHFASMALRIKSVPIIMLDPQDQVFNEMRGMIKVLQEDCKSLARALTQICSAGAGADISSVLQTLPPNLVNDALRYGSASAPALDQQLRQRSPPARGQKPRRGSLRLSGSMGKAKAVFMSKPATADPAMRHSMPALLPYQHGSSSGPASPTRAGGRQQHSRSMQQQQPPPWASSSTAAADLLLPPLGQHSGGGGGYKGSSPGGPGWNMYSPPPRSSNGTPLSRSRHPGAISGRPPGRLLDGVAGNVSLGPSTGAKLYPGSLRQELYTAGASGLKGVLSGSSPLLGFGGGKPGWAFENKVHAPPPRTSQLFVAPAAAGEHREAGAAAAAAGADGSGSRASGMRGIWGLPAGPAVGKRAQEPQAPSLGSFPELALLEQQFQLRQQQGQRQGQQQGQQEEQGNASPPRQFDVQLLGSSGVLLPSGLPACIGDPHSLVPVCMGVADGDCVGTSPEASPVAVALSAADSQCRPMAVPLPAELSKATALTAAAAAAAAAASGENGDGGMQQQQQQPDPQALTWGQRNVWFGADNDMTRLAYEVHDMLVGEQGVDPTSQLYYTAIESHMAAAFPHKWAHWQQATSGGLAATAARGRGGTSGQPSAGQPQQQSAYVSYKLPLKPSVPRFSSPPRQQQQQHAGQLRSEGSGSPTGWTGTGAGGFAGTLPLSQLLQHPALGSALSNQQQQQQQQVLDRNLPQQLLQQYQQEHPELVLQQLQQQQHHLQQQMAAAALAVQAASGQQQQQLRSSLPELRHSESPQPPGDDAQQQQQQDGSPRGLPAAGLGILASASGLGVSKVSVGSGGGCHHRFRYHQQQQTQQQQDEGPALTASRSSIGGISAAASRVLQASQPSFYDGAGPLTSGTRPVWAGSGSSQQRSVQAGQDMAQVLRSGLHPGNKSLAELQAEYKAARAMVLDRLRQQKEAAEVQRKQILLQLGRAISNSAWRA